MGQLFVPTRLLLIAAAFGIGAAAIVYVVVSTTPMDEVSGAENGFSARRILANCGLFFSPAIIGFGVTGLAYLFIFCGTNRIFRQSAVSEGFGPRIAQMQQQVLARKQKDKAKAKKQEKGASSATQQSPLASAAEQIYSKSKQDSGQSGQQQPSRKTGPNAADPAAQTTESPGQTRPVNQAPLSLEHLSGLHAWLLDRLTVVLRTLFSQGPESARTENQVAADQDEAAVASALIPAQVCEWIMPLLGFLGTVWGLHKAIGPLSTGVEMMMEALGTSGNGNLRHLAMGQFKAGFDGLKIAFDTTMLGLVGVVVVGLMLAYVRRRAMQSLTEISRLAEQAVQALPGSMGPVSESLQQIQQAVQLGLIGEQDDKQQPYLAGLPAVKEAINHGLLNQQTGQQDRSWLSLATEAINENTRSNEENLAKQRQEHQAAMQGAARVLARILRAALGEQIKQTNMLSRAVAPDVRTMRNHICPQAEGDKETPPHLDLEPVQSLHPRWHIRAVAVGNGASRVAVGGWDRDANQNFVEERCFDWFGNAFKATPGWEYVESIVGELEPDQERARSYKIDASVMDLTYSPDCQQAFLLHEDGRILVFSSEQMSAREPLSGYCVGQPFIWLPISRQQPYLATWEMQDTGRYELQIVPAMQNGSQIGQDNDLKTFLRRFEHVSPRQMWCRVRTDQRLVCIASAKHIAVAELLPGPALKLVRLLNVKTPITAVDISVRAHCAVFAQPGIGIFRWDIDRHQQPRQIVVDKKKREISHLFVNADGTLLTAVSNREVALYPMAGSGSALASHTGEPIRFAAHSQDRQSIVIASEDNIVRLLNLDVVT